MRKPSQSRLSFSRVEESTPASSLHRAALALILLLLALSARFHTSCDSRICREKGTENCKLMFSVLPDSEPCFFPVWNSARPFPPSCLCDVCFPSAAQAQQKVRRSGVVAKRCQKKVWTEEMWEEDFGYAHGEYVDGAGEFGEGVEEGAEGTDTLFHETDAFQNDIGVYDEEIQGAFPGCPRPTPEGSR